MDIHGSVQALLQQAAPRVGGPETLWDLVNSNIVIYVLGAVFGGLTLERLAELVQAGRESARQQERQQEGQNEAMLVQAQR